MAEQEQKWLRRIVVCGGGTAGWMAAAALSKTFGDTISLTLIESDAIGTIGVGEATIPPMQRFHRLIDIGEIDFMRETRATFKLGISFDNWKTQGEGYFHSFGTTGQDHWTSGFQHFWLNGLERGFERPYGDYCFELVAAAQNKFGHLPKDGLNYAYHLDASRYAQFLRRFAEPLGAKRVEGKINHVQLDSDSGFITAVELEDGQQIEGDFFIDCTGFRALLIGEALGCEFEDWGHYLPCDRAVALQTESVGPAVPYTRSIAHAAGWQWRIPLQHRVGNGLVYSSAHMNDDDALSLLLANIEGNVLSEPNPIRFRTGTRKKQWVKNCIAVGLSSGFMEPLESTSIHLIQRSILRFMQLMPNQQVSQSDIDQFNRQADWEMRTIRDFLILHYHANERSDPFWTVCREMNIPDTLHHKISLFEETGRVFRENEELFAENSWVQVMMGQGIVPKSHHPLAHKMPDDELDFFLTKLRERVAKTVANLPYHDDYVRSYCHAKDTTTEKVTQKSVSLQ